MRALFNFCCSIQQQKFNNISTPAGRTAPPRRRPLRHPPPRLRLPLRPRQPPRPASTLSAGIKFLSLDLMICDLIGLLILYGYRLEKFVLLIDNVLLSSSFA